MPAFLHMDGETMNLKENKGEQSALLAMDFFDDGKIKEGAECLLAAYDENYNKNDILSCFDEIFFKPNLQELGRIYETNCQKIYDLYNKKASDLNDLPYLIIPIEEDYFYLYIKETQKIISEPFDYICRAVIKLCTDENLEIEKDQDILKYLELEMDTLIKKKFKDSDVKAMYNIDFKEIKETDFRSKKLHVGCGRNILQGWINLDLVALPGVDIVADLDDCKNTQLTLSRDSIEEFFVSHVIEHINNPLEMMQELHRVAKPNAKAVFRCPYGSSDEAFEDPTHVRQYFLSSFGYFSQPFYWRADYGYRGDWITEKITLVVDKNKYKGKKPQNILEEINKYRNVVKEMIVELRAVKPIREPKRELQISPEIEICLN